MALTSNQQSYSSLHAIYEGCHPDEKLFGEKLASIVGYVMQSIGINNYKSDGQTPQHSYYRYCEVLSNRIGNYKPYSQSITIETCKNPCKQKIAKDITDLLPRRSKEFDMIISIASEQVTQKLQMSPRNLLNLLYQTASKELHLTESSVFKIFKIGESLHLIPCLFQAEVHQSARAIGFGLFNWSENQITASYQQRTYVLNKLAIKEIIEGLKTRNSGRW